MSLDSLLLAATSTPSNNDARKDSKANILESDLKFIFVGGKGGVGKTTSSGAIATLLSSHCQRRVLLVSTDPAHSLGDAFRRTGEFSNVPTPVVSSDFEHLHVMEIDPSETMKTELSKWAQLADDVAGGNDDGSNDWVKKIHSFQEWLSGIPGIDEATALSSAIRHIESGEYDLIVFDTAPTGHTLKLLAMPQILEAGIEKLQSWQSTLWGVWETFKGFRPGAAGDISKKKVNAKLEVSSKLEEYKRGIQKVALMLQDPVRTRFVVVCIAEYLSISETRRLLQELKKNGVRASHVIVNQLVNDALDATELEELEGHAEVGGLQMNQILLRKTVHACRLTTSRRAIQQRYLKELKSFPETQDILEGICEVPLLPEEVTGNEALKRFGNLMVTKLPSMAPSNGSEVRGGGVARPLYEDILNKKKITEEPGSESVPRSEWVPGKGDVVTITGLKKSAQYNGLEGTVISDLDPDTGRYGVSISFENKKKKLALQPGNMNLVSKAKKHKGEGEEGTDVGTAGSGGGGGTSKTSMSDNMNVAKKLLDDPEINSMVESNPKFADAVKDVMENPMNFMKYLGDPEMSPLVTKAMQKLKG